MLDILTPISNRLTTEHIFMRAFKQDDSSPFYHLVQSNKERLIESFSVTLDNTADESTTSLFIQNKILDWDERIAFGFGIWEKYSDRLIGYLNIKNIDWVIPRAELAYFIDSGFEGKGFMKEALNKAIEFCFEELKMNRLCLRVVTANGRSIKLAEKCGFIKEGTMRKDYRTFDGRLVDLEYMGMLYEDFEKIRSGR